VADQVSHPYKTTGKTTVLYTLIFVFLDTNLEDKRFCTNDGTRRRNCGIYRGGRQQSPWEPLKRSCL
jgi:hypothetical protein